MRYDGGLSLWRSRVRSPVFSSPGESWRCGFKLILAPQQERLSWRQPRQSKKHGVPDEALWRGEKRKRERKQ